MGYYYNDPHYGRRFVRNRTPRQDNPELVTRIEKIAARGVSDLTDWERNFLGSLLDAAKKWGRLTAKQHDVLQRIEKKLDPEVQSARKAWNEAWDEDKREAAIFAANYYKANPPYFSDAAERILTDENYIPSEKLFRKMVENKYVQRAIDHANSTPLYEAGTLVTVRNNRNIGGTVYRLRGQDVLVLDVQQSVTSATKGAREYTVLPIGAAHPVVTEERWLKRAKKS